MNLRPYRREEPEISLTPLIDIVFLLLIFFMVTTTFRKESEFDVTLPEASRMPAESEAPLVVAIDAGGRYALNDTVLDGTGRGDLEAALGAALEDGPEGPVLVIRADAQAPHQAVVRVLDAAGRLGLERIAIATVPEAP
ncbi:MAG: biopolymer transporter ExbD [Candidatus Competibacterales bacterium]|nr:biopolymer transporter ExbD [Candidatus Competibacterales bacterium]